MGLFAFGTLNSIALVWPEKCFAPALHGIFAMWIGDGDIHEDVAATYPADLAVPMELAVGDASDRTLAIVRVARVCCRNVESGHIDINRMPAFA
ncbi:hypothetical protein ATK86_5643 [Nocardia fluminea]|uniref:Uncharacterized protein n=1 Tax=Nocardia fluminea TaxID=134984 RepID=A0A2N3VHT1_9NOCA|nr:hypothetical protein ATK86_5643 [Nocardia fluminea]